MTRAIITRERHVIHVGELSDMPGRCESWIETVAYLGHRRWSLCIDSTDFCRFRAEPLQYERLSTKGMLAWTFERDGEDRDSERAMRREQVESDDDENDEDDLPPGPGPRTRALLEAARAEGATHCVRLLTSPPKPKRPRMPKVTAIIGVQRRGIWIHMSTLAIAVETTVGPGYLKPSEVDWTTGTLYSRQGGGFAQSWPIKLTQQQADVVRLLWLSREVAGASLNPAQSRN